MCLCALPLLTACILKGKAKPQQLANAHNALLGPTPQVYADPISKSQDRSAAKDDEELGSARAA